LPMAKRNCRTNPYRSEFAEPLHCKMGLSEEEKITFRKELSEKGLSNYKIELHSSNSIRHPHPHLAIGRKFATKMVTNTILSRYSNPKFLDVGLTNCIKGLANPNLYHSVETDVLNNQHNGYNTVRLHELEYNTPSAQEWTPSYAWYRNDALTHLQKYPNRYNGLLFVHSIYYNSPENLVKMLLLTRSKMAFVVAHKLDDADPKGQSFCFGEAHYIRSNGMVQMKTRGNYKPYIHPVQTSDYYFNEHTEVKVENGTYTLCSKTTQVGSYNNYIIEIHLIHHKETLAPYERPDQMGDKPIAPTLKTYNYGIKSNFVIIEEKDKKILLNETLIEKVARRHLFSLINDKLVTTLVRELGFYGDNPDLSTYQPDVISSMPYLMDAVFKAICGSNASKEKLWLTQKARGVIQRNNLANQQTLSPVVIYEWILWVLSWMFAPLGKVLSLTRPLWRFFVPIATISKVGCFGVLTPVFGPSYLMMAIIVYLGILTIMIVNSMFKPIEHRSQLEQWMFDIRKTRDTSLSPSEFRIPFGTTIPSVLSRVDLSNYPVAKENAFTITEVLPPDPRSWGLLICGPQWLSAQALCFKTCQHNIVISVRSRAICVQKDCDPEYWLVLRSLFFHNRNMTGGITLLNRATNKDYNLFAGECMPTYRDKYYGHTFDEWNDHFDPPQQKSNRHYRKMLDEKGLDRNSYNFTCFSKREAQLIVGKRPFTPIRPRNISAINPTLKVVTGPGAYSWSKALTAAWNPNHYIFYASGASADDLNEYFSQRVQPNSYFLVSDFSKYDASQGKEAWDFLTDLIVRMGILPIAFEQDIIKYVYKQTKVFGPGLKYKVTATMKTGANVTSVCNTILNVAVWYLALYEYCHRNITLLKSHLVNRYITYAALGDDGLTIMNPNRIIPNRFRDVYVETTNRLGFTVTSTCTNNPVEADFLNMRLYPVQGGIRVGRKPGRVICKAGVIDSPRREVTQDDYVKIHMCFKSNLYASGPTACHVPFLRVYRSVCMRWMEKNIPSLHLLKPRKYAHLKGQCSEADYTTWDAFERFYNLSQKDEDLFKQRLEERINLYGLTHVADDPIMDMLVSKDL